MHMDGWRWVGGCTASAGLLAGASSGPTPPAPPPALDATGALTAAPMLQVDTVALDLYSAAGWGASGAQERDWLAGPPRLQPRATPLRPPTKAKLPLAQRNARTLQVLQRQQGGSLRRGRLWARAPRAAPAPAKRATSAQV